VSVFDKSLRFKLEEHLNLEITDKSVLPLRPPYTETT